MNDRPTPETDSEYTMRTRFYPQSLTEHAVVSANFARRLERERDDLREKLRLANEDGIKCPFCHETDFDEVGLKMHFTRFGCEAFDKLSCDVPTTHQARMKGETR